MLTSHHVDFTGKNILVVEDEALIAMEMAEAIEAAGGTVLGPVPSVEAAMDFVHGDHRIDGAILDVRLTDGISLEVAQTLKKIGVPLIFVTGYDDWFMPSDLDDVPVERKPSDPDNIVRILFETTQSTKD